MEKINRESRALFSSESRVSMRGQVYNVPRGLVWDMFLGVEERESEVIASKRERELRSMAGRESRPRERVCSVSLCRRVSLEV